MCKTCGCDGDAKVTVTNLQTGNEEWMERSTPVTSPHHAHDHHHDHHHMTIITIVMSHMITIMRTMIMIILMHPSPRLSPRSPVPMR